MERIMDFLKSNPWFTLIGAITLIQISPIKIDPWAWIFKHIRDFLVGDLTKSVETLEKMVTDEKISNKRWHILDFSNSCRQGRHHSKEEWDHCLSELNWYEDYCKKNDISNGVIKECAKYLRTMYQERLVKNDFLG